MTCVDLWIRLWHHWRDDQTMKKLCVASCILNPYLQANMMHHALGETKPYKWKTIRRKWRVFRDAENPTL